MSETVLITGGAGFIGSHLVEHLHRNTKYNIVIIDKLTYSSKGLERLRETELLNSSRVKVFTCDLTTPLSDGIKKEIGDVDYIFHLCAETHVDTSISNPAFVIENNVMSTVNILQYARGLKLKKFFYFSTDEVYGDAPKDVYFKEWERHKPTNPYSASKSAGESICISYGNTYKVPILIVNVMNAFGERQHVEKFIPKCIKYILEGKELEIHTDTDCKTPGSRFYIHSRNISDALLFLIDKGEIGDKYNIVGEKEVNNLEMAQIIAGILGKELKYKLLNFIKDRPGHDLRYTLDGSKLIKMGWKVPINFEKSLEKVILWTVKNPKWLEE